MTKMHVYGIFSKKTQKPMIADKGREIYFRTSFIADGYCLLLPDAYNEPVTIDYDPIKHKIAGVK